MTPSPSALAARFVEQHLGDWIAPSGPVMVGDVRTNAHGALVGELAKLLLWVQVEAADRAKVAERDRAAATTGDVAPLMARPS